MNFSTYQESDASLRERAQLALYKAYALQDAVKLRNKLHVFDTEDGYRIILIKERDPEAFGFNHPVLHISVQAQEKSKVLLPETRAGWVSLAARLLVRLGLTDCASRPIDANLNKATQSIHVWFIVEAWDDQRTQAQVA